MKLQYKPLFFLSILSGLLIMNFYIWSIISPIGSGIDDDFHLPSVWCAYGDKIDFCETVIPNDGLVKVPEILVEAPLCVSYQNYKSASCILEFLNSNKNLEVGRSNESGRFPNLFYKFNHLLIDNENIENSIQNMRLVSGLFFIFCLILGYFITNSEYKNSYLLINIFLTTPFVYSIVVSNNPSSWLISASLLFISMLFSFLGKSSSIKLIIQSFCLAICLVLAFGSRSEGPTFLAVTSIIFFIIFFKRLNIISKSMTLVVAILGIFSTFNQPSTLGFTTGLSETGRPRNVGIWLFEVISELPNFIFGVFGSWGFGWLDFEMPIFIYFFYFIFFFGFIFINLPIISKQTLLFAFLNFSIINFIVLRVMYLSSNTVGVNIQPRYLVPFLYIIVNSLLTFLPNFYKNAKRYIIIFIVPFSLSYSFALHGWINHFVSGTQNFSINLSAKIEWWWDKFLLPTPIWIFSSVIYLLTLLVVVLINKFNVQFYKAKHALNN